MDSTRGLSGMSSLGRRRDLEALQHHIKREEQETRKKALVGVAASALALGFLALLAFVLYTFSRRPDNALLLASQGRLAKHVSSTEHGRRAHSPSAAISVHRSKKSAALNPISRAVVAHPYAVVGGAIFLVLAAATVAIVVPLAAQGKQPDVPPSPSSVIITQTESTDNIGAVVGGAVGGLVGLIVLVVVIAKCCGGSKSQDQNLLGRMGRGGGYTNYDASPRSIGNFREVTIDSPMENIPAGATASGLANQGNTCYFNSLIQALFPVADLFNLAVGLTQGEGLLRRLFTAMAKSDGAVNPRALIREMGARNPMYNRGQQQDSSEALMDLMGMCEHFKGLFDVDLLRHSTCLRCNAQATTSVKNPIFIAQIPSVDDRCTLKNIIDHTLKEERIANYTCIGCNGDQNRPAKITWEVESTRLVLSIALVRYLNDLTKVTTKVDVPLRLEFNGKNFDLVSGVFHHGVARATGHYTAKVINPGGQTLRHVSDSYVNGNVAITENAFEDAYMLFYRCVDAQAEDPVTVEEPVASSVESSADEPHIEPAVDPQAQVDPLDISRLLEHQ